jgi:hypothetical protein
MIASKDLYVPIDLEMDLVKMGPFSSNYVVKWGNE